MGGVLPGARSLDEFWNNVLAGRSASKPIPSERWVGSPDQALDADPNAVDAVYSIKACLVEGFSLAGAGLELSDDWARRLDPAVWFAVEAGTMAWRDCSGQRPAAERVGVVLGNIVLPTTATNALTAEHFDALLRQRLGLAPSPRRPFRDAFDPRCRFAAHFPAGLLAQLLGLGGKTFCIDAACASSLYALKYASDELAAGRADAMLAGGVARPDCMYTQMGFGQLKALSPSGRCAPFDASADGLVVGEGAGIFVLKRLADAEASGDRIHGVLRGFGLSNDVGGRLLAPSSEGQLRALRAAYRQANWQPTDVDLIECHATGTPVGDAVEVESLRQLHESTQDGSTWSTSSTSEEPRRVVLGGVKSNVGHLLTGAGAAALLKVLHCLRDRVLAPTAHFAHANAQLKNLLSDRSPSDGSNGSFEVLRQPRPWAERAPGRPRRAAINGFGFGGINAHVLVEEYIAGSQRTDPAVDAAGQVGGHAIAVVAAEGMVGREFGPEALLHSLFTAAATQPAGSARLRFPELKVAADRFRIPPVEMADMLPQQLALLVAADDAVRAAQWPEGPKHKFGAFIGLELDLDATNFHYRWSQLERAGGWAAEHGLAVGALDKGGARSSGATIEIPPLSANRVMGALGGIVASRVAREFSIGGPCHTVSCEAASGLAALELAVRALRAGELDEALVGAVDLAADPRHVACVDAISAAGGATSQGAGSNAPPGDRAARPPADAAVAVVLKRLNDAKRDGNRVLAIFADEQNEVAERIACPVDAGAASGLLDFVAACHALDRSQLPASDGPIPWLRDRCNGPRQAVVVATDILGKPWQCSLQESEHGNRFPSRQSEQPQPLRQASDVAFVYAGSGNHYAGMGRRLAAHFPEILARHDASTDRLRRQLQPERFWRTPPPADWDAQVLPLIIGQVAWSMLATDVVRDLGIEPTAAIGYSLGESSALFSLGAWRDRDLMFDRLERSSLFRTDLCGPCAAARASWGMGPGEDVDWVVGIVNTDAEEVRSRLADFERVYLLIVNAPGECAIGGARRQVRDFVRALGATFVELRGVSTVHCPVARAVAPAYRALHLLPTTPPPSVRFYSSALQRAYALTSEAVADAILGQAVDAVDFAATIETAFAEGIRTFVEIGPGNSCSRMIAKILRGRPHRVFAPFTHGEREVDALLEMVEALRQTEIPPFPTASNSTSRAVSTPYEVAQHAGEPVLFKLESSGADSAVAWDAHSSAHDAYLKFSYDAMKLFAQQATLQAQMLTANPAACRGTPTERMRWPSESSFGKLAVPAPRQPSFQPAPSTPPRAFDRAACLEYGSGLIGRVLGPQFAEIDAFPTRVRLPDVPLNFVDRIVDVEAVPRSLGSGSVVTEHDVLVNGWYLDNGVMPTCFAVEAGQADLFLSGYLGIDFVTRGAAVYRLLDAKVTFHRGLPRPGEIIRYDIWIDGFFRQGETHLFRFRFEGTIDGVPLLSMRDGCAGFFTAEELAAGKGIVHTSLDLRPLPGKATPDFAPFVPLAEETYDETQLAALRRGDLAGCFGPAFAHLAVDNPLTLPDAPMKLIDRVVKLDPTGGRYGLGLIRAEADIHPDDWFIVCHFVDDPVMPGTLMYECCLHTLRVLLLRLGWVADASEAVCEPVPGVTGSLKCRGQVLGSTKVAAYEVALKEIGYGPEPYAIVDALMFADGKPIVEIGGMSLKMTGIDRATLEARWSRREAGSTTTRRITDADKPPADRLPALYDRDRILEFATGKPSKAFGEPYRVFDEGRVIARLPGPPYQFLDRIVEVEGEPWRMKAGGRCVAQYDVPPDEWYFAAECAPVMPFAVLLEVALQPCGWLAAYVGSALSSDIDLSFRNLGGSARLFEPVGPDAGTLTTEVRMTRCSASGGMVIQNYDMVVRRAGRVVYQGDTYFGFFSKQALANQVGIRDAKLHQPAAHESSGSCVGDYPTAAPFPDERLRMVDRVEIFAPNGGAHGLGFIRGTKTVDPAEWFFQAHFFQDPVCPGSLGLESFLQLLKLVGAERWKLGKSENDWFMTTLAPTTHTWIYRGQVIPADKQVTVEATVTGVDDASRSLTADGFLSVDGRTIYQMKDFSLAFRRTDR